MTEDLIQVQMQPEPVDSGVRFTNFIIDWVVRLVLSFMLGGVLGVLIPDFFIQDSSDILTSRLWDYLFGAILSFMFYTLFEGLTKGKTIGKMITGTRAIREDGNAITFADAALRSLCRLVPFEPFSIWGDGLWHDRWTDTLVVKDDKRIFENR